MDEFDFFVIGAGSGGVRAARIAAALGARVGIAEQARLGGTCVNVGCVPKKLLVNASQFAVDAQDARGFGWEGAAHRHAWGALRTGVDAAVARLNAGYGRTLDGAGAELWTGRARLEDAHTVFVDGRRARAKHILIATGGRPRPPTLEGREHAMVSDDVFALSQCPQRVLLVGGGYIALEFAGIFHGLGATTHVVHRSERVLRDFDQELGPVVVEAMRGRGIDVRLSEELARIEKSAGGLDVDLASGGSLQVDGVVFCIGRVPMTQGLGLETAGVSVGAGGYIEVDAACRTSVSHIYAVGDVIGGFELTPVAIKQGQAVAEALFGDGSGVADLDGVPSAVFSQPPVAAVGLDEAGARAAGHAVEVFRSRFTPLKHTLTGRQDRTLMKLVVDAATQRVLGCHMVGPDAPEIMQGLAVAMKAGATKAHFDATVGIHPTAAEEFVTMKG